MEGKFVCLLWPLADKVKGSRGQDRCDLRGHLASPSTQSADLPNGAFDLCLFRLWAFFSFVLCFFYCFLWWIQPPPLFPLPLCVCVSVCVCVCVCVCLCLCVCD